jgi:hypothetical protein
MIASWAPDHRSSELSHWHLSTTTLAEPRRRRRVSRNLKDSHQHRQCQRLNSTVNILRPESGSWSRCTCALLGTGSGGPGTHCWCGVYHASGTGACRGRDYCWGPGEVVREDLPVPVSFPSVQAVQPGRQSGWHRWASCEHRPPLVETVGTQPGIAVFGFLMYILWHTGRGRSWLHWHII